MFHHARFVRFRLLDSQGADAAGAKKIEISHLNVAPDLQIPETATQFIEGSPPTAIAESVRVVDPDSPNFAGGALHVTFAEESGRDGDRLSIRDTELGLICIGLDNLRRGQHE